LVLLVLPLYLSDLLLSGVACPWASFLGLLAELWSLSKVESDRLMSRYNSPAKRDHSETRWRNRPP
ncbi:hypothetical protein, partial [Nostoc sp.]|uniref:hypothetical protein n=1 Tax=Nostoc sp. TaxID=1180 RepID=UPI002FF736B0